MKKRSVREIRLGKQEYKANKIQPWHLSIALSSPPCSRPQCSTMSCLSKTFLHKGQVSIPSQPRLTTSEFILRESESY